MYAALILNSHYSKVVDERFENLISSGRGNDTETNMLFCYVKLTCNDFKDRLVHFNDVAHDDFSIFINYSSKKISIEDMVAIKDEIETDKRIPLGLSTLIKDIPLK